jgi:hypothetical protein
MHGHSEPVRPKESDLTPRQRWIAAQRLAAGDTIRMAAVQANTTSAVLSLLHSEDPEFQGLVEDCRAVHQMPRDEWRVRAEAYARDAAERAMVDGRVSTLNLCLKATDLLGATVEDEPDDLDAWMDRLTDEEWADYESLGEEGLQEAARAIDTPADPVPPSLTDASAIPGMDPPGAIPAPAGSSAMPALRAASTTTALPRDRLTAPSIATNQPTAAAALDRATRQTSCGATLSSARHTPSLYLPRSPSHPPPATAGPRPLA